MFILLPVNNQIFMLEEIKRENTLIPCVCEGGRAGISGAGTSEAGTFRAGASGAATSVAVML